ncbi:2-pyrone-4,6-dicarboxylic acid hydrolase [Bordetella pertussis]|nr:2-pyrone-4,6-dicarboxylic acid hydrolase [Bordetella pertussis]
MVERARLAEGGGWDCHFHVFDASRYTLAAGSAYQPEDASLAAFRGVCRARGIGRAVLVHPSVYGADHSSYEDALAANGDWLRGVAVVYPDEATTPDARIEHWDLLGTAGTRINRLFPGAPQHPERIVERVKPFGWHVQVLTDIVEDIGLVRRIAARDVPVVVDHFGHHPHAQLLRSAGWQDLIALVRGGRPGSSCRRRTGWARKARPGRARRRWWTSLYRPIRASSCGAATGRTRPITGIRSRRRTRRRSARRSRNGCRTRNCAARSWN